MPYEQFLKERIEFIYNHTLGLIYNISNRLNILQRLHPPFEILV